jgi:hypothetical protein
MTSAPVRRATAARRHAHTDDRGYPEGLKRNEGGFTFQARTCLLAKLVGAWTRSYSDPFAHQSGLSHAKLR